MVPSLLNQPEGDTKYMMQNGDKHFKDWRLVDEAKLWSNEDLPFND